MAKYGKIIGKDCNINTNEYETILGIPALEAFKVLTLYSETKRLDYNKDYIVGFEDGYNRAYSELEKYIK